MRNIYSRGKLYSLIISVISNLNQWFCTFVSQQYCLGICTSEFEIFVSVVNPLLLTHDHSSLLCFVLFLSFFHFYTFIICLKMGLSTAFLLSSPNHFCSLFPFTWPLYFIFGLPVFSLIFVSIFPPLTLFRQTALYTIVSAKYNVKISTTPEGV